MGLSADNQNPRLESSHIADIVRTRDMDRYLAVLLSPRDKQPALMALAAFHCELGHIHHAVSEPSLVAIRFQWWRDALQSVTTGEQIRTGNPVADLLIGIVRTHDLPMELIDEMLDVHQSGPEQTNGDIAEKAPMPEAPLFELSALVLGGVREERLRQASTAAAIACAAAKSLKGERAGLADIAASKRRECAELLRGLPDGIFPAFLPLSLTEFNLEAAPENPWLHLRRVWTIWRTHRKKTLD